MPDLPGGVDLVLEGDALTRWQSLPDAVACMDRYLRHPADLLARRPGDYELMKYLEAALIEKLRLGELTMLAWADWRHDRRHPVPADSHQRTRIRCFSLSDVVGPEGQDWRDVRIQHRAPALEALEAEGEARGRLNMREAVRLFVDSLPAHLQGRIKHPEIRSNVISWMRERYPGKNEETIKSYLRNIYGPVGDGTEA